jgi:hypothetical protein
MSSKVRSYRLKSRLSYKARALGRLPPALPLSFVIPANAGIQLARDARKKSLDPGFRRGDAQTALSTCFVIAGLVPGNPMVTRNKLRTCCASLLDARNKSGHDAAGDISPLVEREGFFNALSLR